MAQKVKNYLSIKSWSVNDKPREKLRFKGKAALTDTELIAILLRTGSAGKNALELARSLLEEVNYDLIKLGTSSLESMIKIPGIGPAKAISIAAALELGRRRGAGKQHKLPRIKDSSGAFNILRPLIGELDHEEFWILYLNNAHAVLHSQQLSKGGITGTLVDVRLIIKRALELGAVAMILAHNHPSGNLKPSPSDKLLTKKLTAGAKLMDLKVLDHLILSYNDYFSFADAQLL